MAIDDENPQSGAKLPYEKPVVRTIELYAEEVLAVGCKLGSGTFGAFGASPCTLNFCAQAGS